MLPAHLRLTRPVEFSSTVRDGRRVGRRRVVVHVRPPVGQPSSEKDRAHERPAPAVPAPGAVVLGGPARVGLVVSKSVGPAVVRHAVSRKLRHVVAPMLPDLPDGTLVVLRALPAASTATSAELAGDVRSALLRLGVLDQRP